MYVIFAKDFSPKDMPKRDEFEDKERESFNQKLGSLSLRLYRVWNTRNSISQFKRANAVI